MTDEEITEMLDREYEQEQLEKEMEGMAEEEREEYLADKEELEAENKYLHSEKFYEDYYGPNWADQF